MVILMMMVALIWKSNAEMSWDYAYVVDHYNILFKFNIRGIEGGKSEHYPEFSGVFSFPVALRVQSHITTSYCSVPFARSSFQNISLGTINTTFYQKQVLTFTNRTDTPLESRE
jgi:hypothetical protein